jgi:hypothetical protein
MFDFCKQNNVKTFSNNLPLIFKSIHVIAGKIFLSFKVRCELLHFYIILLLQVNYYTINYCTIQCSIHYFQYLVQNYSRVTILDY